MGAELMYPGCFTTANVKRLSSRPQVSSSTVKWRQVCLDAAFVLYMRKEYAAAALSGGITRYAWADSSPQAVVLFKNE